jgi:hypothetical protein
LSLDRPIYRWIKAEVDELVPGHRLPVRLLEAVLAVEPQVALAAVTGEEPVPAVLDGGVEQLRAEALVLAIGRDREPRDLPVRLHPHRADQAPRKIPD